jgi:hypothetical protein
MLGAHCYATLKSNGALASAQPQLVRRHGRAQRVMFECSLRPSAVRRIPDAGYKLSLDYERPGTGGTCAAGGDSMSKGNDRKKETKKKPAKSLMEKRAAKAEKRSQKKQWAMP